MLRIACTVFDKINATITVKLASLVGAVNDKNKAQGSIADVLSNVVDANLIHFFVRDYWKIQAYPRLSDEIKIVSLKTIENNTDNFLALFKNEASFYLIIILYVGCTVALKYIFKLTFSTALLNFVRMLVNMAIPIIPVDLASKILLVVLSFTMLATNSFVGSLLSAIETVPKIPFEINTIDDLIRSNLTIAGPNTVLDMISSQSVIRERYRDYSDVRDCINDLLNGQRVTCISRKAILIYYLPANTSIHMSRGNLLERSVTYTLATDWPLLEKFDFVLSLISEAGLIDVFYGREKQYLRSNLYHSKRNIEMEHLADHFLIIFRGWMLSGLIFLLEILTYLIQASLHKLCCLR